jgi:hypothetical protein
MMLAIGTVLFAGLAFVYVQRRRARKGTGSAGA